MDYSNFLDKFFIRVLRVFLLDGFYQRTLWFREFCRFAFSTFIIFWLVRSPMTFIFTEIFHFHYLFSSFSSGVILSIIGFIVNKFVVFRDEK